MLPRVLLKPRRARPFFARHPWVLSNSIARIEGPAKLGDEVELVSHEGKPIARGLFNPQSAIRVRLYRWDEAPIDEAFLTSRLESALRLRAGLPGRSDPDGAARLVNSEGDGLSGLIVDRYGPWLVAQVTSAAIYERKDWLFPELARLTGAKGIVLRGDKSTADQEGLKLAEGPAWGATPPPLFDVTIDGISSMVDVRSGQKTGLYLDQRENRRAVALYLKGRTVLDLFCHTGGFGLSALKDGGASSVLGVDRSATAIEFAEQNARTNGLLGVEFRESDALEALAGLKAEGRTFGAIVCDPPKYARGHNALEDALKGYVRLNSAAVSLLAPDGLLATCSCSGLVDRSTFLDVLAHVAETTGRNVQVLEQRGQAPDHPVQASCLESEYLKCVICRVE